MLRSLFFGILLLSCMVSCKRWPNNSKNLGALVELQIQQLKLESYPEIKPCKEKNRPCFENQLLEILERSLPESVTTKELITKDTLWVTIKVLNKENSGFISTKFESITPLTERLQFHIDSSLANINPIKPGYIQGIPVSCKFQLPLIINK